MKKRKTLAEANPELAKQWHPTKNGDLKPTDVSTNSGKKVWWYLPYDDPETGKHFVFEWMSTVRHRTKGCGCPFLSGRAVWPGFNDLATKAPELAKQWHPTMNGDLKPTDVTAYCNDKVYWYLPYDDPETGKHFDFEWSEIISNRTKGYGCPFLSGQAVWAGFNDLATKVPELAKQWHPTLNGDLKPMDVITKSKKKVWWYLPYDDPETGKHFDFEWMATVSNRTQGKGCPFLSGHSVWPGFNDLATKAPELAKQWHPTKNGTLKPTDVTLHSGEKVYWLLPYDDPDTGGHFEFEWVSTVYHRAYDRGCPFLSGRAVWPGFNDLATKAPELAKQWHPTMNGDLKPTDVTAYCNDKVYWYLPYDDPETGEHFDFEWQASINSRNNGSGCPFLSGQKVCVGFNDLAAKAPELAKQWHPTLNGDLKPTDVTTNSGKKVWWYLPYDDLKTGKHFDFEWMATVSSGTQGNGCPFLSGRAVWPGFNDLATKAPELAKQWHPTLNGDLKPTDVTPNSGKKVWWHLPYDDSKTGKHYDFAWRASIDSRMKGAGCPFLCGKAVWPGFNDLATNVPDIAAEWHSSKNRKRTPDKVYERDTRRYWWRCPDCGNSWRASVQERVLDERTCPKCKNKDKKV